MNFLLCLVAIAINIVAISIFTIVTAGVGWLLSLLLPLNMFQCSVLFLGCAFVMFYAKRNQGKGQLPSFLPDEPIEFPVDDDDGLDADE